MSFLLQPWHLMFFVFAGWANREQQEVIEYLRTENQVLREKLGKKRILLNDDQRRRLGAKGKILERKLLEEFGTLFTPDTLGRKALMELTTIVDTILRWHRQLVAQKWNYSDRRKKKPGRPRIRQVIVDLILRFARENPSWGYDRIQGALANVDYYISDTTVGNVLKQHGIEPAPIRKTTGSWSTFLKAHWDVLAAIDFTTVEVWTKDGLVTFYLLFVMELKTRRVCFAGCTTSPHEAWMKQAARELTNFEDGFLNDKRYLMMDRDTKFCQSFRSILKQADVKSVVHPPRSPNLNSFMERFFLSLKTECLDRMIFFGEGSLRNATKQFLAHDHGERNHQGLGNQLIEPCVTVESTDGAIDCRERLGGTLRYYHRRAA